MTGPDDEALQALLRARLDDELASVHADRRVLAHVLSRPVARRSRKSWAGGLAAVTALGAAVAVAVVAAPSPGNDALEQLAGPSPSIVPTSSPATPTSPPSSTTPSTPAVPATSAPPTVSATPATPAAPATPAKPAITAAPTRTGPSPACSRQSSDPGEPVVRVDLDGDGVPDALTYDGGALHVVLGAGRGEISSAFSTASPYLSVLPVSTAGTARRQVLIGMRGQISASGAVGAVARLYDLRDCTFAPVPGVNGKPYDFLVGTASDTERSGVVCDAGVLYGRTAVLKGGTWHVTDRPVTSSAGTAVNGAPRTSTVADGAS